MELLQLPNIGNGGRLGNHLFTIASTIGLALRHGYTPRFPANWKYRNRFNIPDEWFGDIVKPEVEIKERNYEYCDFPIFGDICSISGYLQSPKYWAGFEDKIKQYLTPKGCNPGEVRRVAIHYRRDDYVGNPNYKQLDVAYYLQQYAEYFSGLPITAFSDDIDFIKLHHSGDWSHTDDPVDELAAMAAHQYHITANSTFSWWGAYLSGGFTIHPDDWFDGPLLKTCTIADLFPAEWQLRRTGKCYLKDFTFIIPVSYDHSDRAENLYLIWEYLEKHFYTNIIVGEINTHNFEGAPNYVHFDYGGKFHRTKALNELTMMATTPYVVNLDADVIVPPFQLYKMAEALRNGADVVYPYDGSFPQIPRHHFKQIKADLNIPALRGQHWRIFGVKNSVGGVLGYNKISFLRAGGENERFVSYNPEDQERFWRFNLIGMDVQRIDGNAYHLDHWRGPDSGRNNIDSIAGHKYWDEIKHYTKAQIIDHLKLDYEP